MKNAVNYLEKIQLYLGTLFLVIFVVTTIIQVTTRYLGISATWTEEISVNAFIWSMLLGASVMVRKKKHFSFDFIASALNHKYLPWLIILQNLIMLIFCLLCVVYSSEITNTFWHSRWISFPSLKQGYVWLILPITFLSMSIYLIEDSINQILSLNNCSSTNKAKGEI
ncbi:MULTISPECIES: TRAP transporter small permease [unclassified Lonepinella]|uniref:TRAP transporter small permease n=1 Tax=unclassified Lonepinella TaxID=2642006 RepID=UPI0036D8E428